MCCSTCCACVLDTVCPPIGFVNKRVGKNKGMNKAKIGVSRVRQSTMAAIGFSVR